MKDDESALEMYKVERRYNHVVFAGSKIIHFAECGDYYATKRCMRLGFDPSIQYNSAIILAAAQGHARIVKLLLTNPRVESNVNNHRALYRASENGHVEAVKLLLPLADHADCSHAVEVAVGYGHLEVVRLLLTKIKPTDQIILAARCEHIQMVELLRPVSSGYLEAAAKRGDFEIFLLELPFVELTPLLAIAAENNQFELVDFLMEVEKSNDVMAVCIRVARERKLGKILAHLFRNR